MCILVGDLGQTYDSNQTLHHYISNPKGQAMLFIGDLSYADDYPLHDNRRWDSWGRFIERSAAYQAWIWTAGNHELDFVPEIVSYNNSMNKNHVSISTKFKYYCCCYCLSGRNRAIQTFHSALPDSIPSIAEYFASLVLVKTRLCTHYRSLLLLCIR